MSEDTTYSLKEHYADKITYADNKHLNARHETVNAYLRAYHAGSKYIDGHIKFVITFQTDASKLTRIIANKASNKYIDETSPYDPNRYTDTLKTYHIAKGYHNTRAYGGYAVADLYLEAAKYTDASAYTYVQTFSSTSDEKTLSEGISNIVNVASALRKVAHGYRDAARDHSYAAEAYADVINSYPLKEVTTKVNASVIKDNADFEALDVFDIAKADALATFMASKRTAFDVYNQAKDYALNIVSEKGTDINTNDIYNKAKADAFKVYSDAKADAFKVFSQAKADAFEIYSDAKADAFKVFSQANAITL